MEGKAGLKLQCASLHSLIEVGFWEKLSRLKLNHWGLDESPNPLIGFIAPCLRHGVPSNLALRPKSFPSDPSEFPSSSTSNYVDRNSCPVPGTLYNVNTIENYSDLDKQRLLKEEARKIWDDMHNGEIEKDCARLLRFFVISFADLKKWEFHYAVAYPSFVLDPRATIVDLKPASKWFSLEEAKSVSTACNEWRSSTTTTGVPFFLVTIASDSQARVRHLHEWDSCKQFSGKILFGFYDPSNLPNCPGWPLGNFLAFLYSRWNLETVHFFCYRERGLADMGLSLVGEAQIPPQDWKGHNHVPQAVGWEIYGQKNEKSINLAKTLAPERQAESSAELNLKLMKWRAFPELDIDLLYSTKCLLIGTGTLGCQVGRLLMGWGIRKITLVDSGKVAISNPLRQNLYTLNDVGQYKATAAANSLKSLFPSVDATGVVMEIPMPGHPVSSLEEKNRVLDNCRQLQELVKSHDVVFLLTDTRESRWLPTLLCANANKITINAALGFESYLVMRHGVGPINATVEGTSEFSSDMSNLSMETKDNVQRLGCYFCNDVVAPINSTSNRTLDQQCTVTRPGLAAVASGYAVELLVGLLHHPLRINAPPEVAGPSESGSCQNSLGILAHQIRGSLSQLTMMTLVGLASKSCTACSEIVVSEFQKNGMDFVLDVVNHPTYLEDLTGLTELQKSANSFESNWDVDDEDDDNELV